MNFKENNKSAMAGFTLMEIMVVVAIVGILVAIAVPSYQRSVLRTHRQAAMADMMILQQRMERQYGINNGAYSPIVAPGDCNNTGLLASGAPPRYALAINVFDNSQSYTITATACAGAQSQEECGNLRIDNDDVRMVDVSGSWQVNSVCF